MLALIPTLLLFTGCSVFQGTGYDPGLQASRTSLLRDPYSWYLSDGQLVHADRHYVDRYQCASGAPLLCRCFSQLSQDCDCHC